MIQKKCRFMIIPARQHDGGAKKKSRQRLLKNIGEGCSAQTKTVVPLPFIAWEQGKVTICLDRTYTKAPKEGIVNEILLLGIDGDL